MSPSQQAKDKLDHWKLWLTEDLWDPMSRLLMSREVYRCWHDVLLTATLPPDSSGVFTVWVNDNYLKALMVAIRAVADKRRDTRSLRRLLDDLGKHRSLLTQLRIDQTLLSQHIDQLTAITDDVTKYVNRRLAHHSRKQRQEALIVEGVHEAADMLYDIYHHWYQAICKTTLVPPTVTDTPQQSLERLFTQPWISRSQADQITNKRMSEYQRRFGAWPILHPEQRGY